MKEYCIGSDNIDPGLWVLWQICLGNICWNFCVKMKYYKEKHIKN